MTFTQRLMSTGDWTLRLSPETPSHVLATMDVERFGFGHIVILPTWQKLNQIGTGFTDADRRAQAVYMGVYRSRDSEFEFSGPGMPFWLGDEEGKGDTIATVTGGSAGAGTLTQWLNTITPSGFTGVLMPGSPGDAYIKTFDRVTRREILDDIVSRFNVEWRVTPELDLIVGLTASVFNTDPVAAIVRRGFQDGGGEPHLAALAADFEVQQDLEDWTAEIHYYTGTEETPTLSTATSGDAPQDIPYRGVDGTAIQMDRIIEDFGDTPTSSGPGLAALQLGRFNRIRQELSAASGQFDISSKVAAGDYVWLYDPERTIMNLANEVPYRGGMIWPIKIRCTGITSPIRQGMGVYFRRWIDNNTTTWDVDWVDLTQWVEWDTGSTTVELGDLPRPAFWRDRVWSDRRHTQAQPRYLSSITL